MSELELGDIDGAMRLQLYDRLVADVATKFLATGGEAPDLHRRLVTLIRERGQVFRSEHHRRTSALASFLESDDEAAGDFAAEIAMRADGGGDQ